MINTELNIDFLSAADKQYPLLGKIGESLADLRNNAGCDGVSLTFSKIDKCFRALNSLRTQLATLALEPKAICIFDKNGDHVYTIAITSEITRDIAWDFAQEHINDAVIDGVEGSAKWKASDVFMRPPNQTIIEREVNPASFVNKMSEEILHDIMSQVQVYASSYSLVGSNFASDDQLGDADKEKQRIYEMVKAVLHGAQKETQEPIYIVGKGWQCDYLPSLGTKLYTSPPNRTKKSSH